MSVSIYEAIDIILNNTQKVSCEIVPIENALQRVSAENLSARLSLPPYDNSAMDGYAMNIEGFKKDVKKIECKVIGKIFAGENIPIAPKKGECVKIMTGAVIPSSGVDTVVPQENTTSIGEERISIPASVKIGSNIRKAGDDIKKGEKIISDGEKINSAHIALFASQGITHVKVYRKPKITVFASGKELKLHYEHLAQSQIYNSNTPALLARAKELGANVEFVGKAEDSVEAIYELIESSLDSDIIVTSGGVSVGEADFTKEAFLKAGIEEFFGKVDIKPGKPTSFGKIGKTLILNLPGNPFASSINFEIFGKIAINKLSGLNDIHHAFIDTVAQSDYKMKPGRDTVIPGMFNGKGFEICPKFAPGMVNVLNRCNGFVIFSSDKTLIKKGNPVRFMPIWWDIRSDNFIEFVS